MVHDSVVFGPQFAFYLLFGYSAFECDIQRIGASANIYSQICFHW